MTCTLLDMTNSTEQTRTIEEMAAAMNAHYEAQDDAYRATLDEQQLLAYKRHCGEIDTCPSCGAVDVDVEHDEHPDMIGTSYFTEFSCCGFVRGDGNDALEYDAHGRVCDVR